MREQVERKRNYPRATLDVAARYLTQEGNQRAAATGNISTGGVLLIAEDPQVMPHDEIHVSLQPPGLEQPIESSARVVWMSDRPLIGDTIVFGFGVQFLDLGEADFYTLALLVEKLTRAPADAPGPF